MHRPFDRSHTQIELFFHTSHFNPFFFTFPLASTAHSTSYHEVSPAFLTDVENKYLKKGLSHDLSTLNNTSPLQLLLSPRTHIKRTSYIGSIDDLCCTLFFFFAKR